MRLPLILIIVLCVIAILTDWYILKDIKKYVSLKRLKAWRIGYLISMVLGYGFLIAVISIPVRDESSNILPVMWLLYSFLTIYIPKLLYLICSVTGKLISYLYRRIRGFNSRIKKNYGPIVGVVLGVVAFILLWWGVLFTRNHIEVNRVDIVSSKIPEAFNGYRIVQFSDLHVGTWGNDKSFVRKLVSEINALHPDLIIFSGDIVNRRTDELYPFLEELSKLKAKDGIYSVLGNHDYGDYIDWKDEKDHKANNDLLAEWEKRMGWKLLNNDHVFLRNGNESIVLIGVENWGEPPFPEYGRLSDAYPASSKSKDNLNDNKFKVLVSHNPEHWNREVIKKTNIDLTLSGHTHAMQMMLSAGGWKWSPSGFRYPRWGGLYEEKSKDGNIMYLYVNIGSGEVGMPSRIGSAYPELTEFTLVKK